MISLGNKLRWKPYSLVGLGLAICFALLAPPAGATLVTIDQIIFEQTGTVNPAVLSGTADFTVALNTITLILTNISTGANGGPASTNLLTGIGFNLPSGVTVNAAASSVVITPLSTAIGFTPPITDARWGVDNQPVSAGPFSAGAGLAFSPVNTVVGTVQSMIDFDFNGTPTGGPGGANVDGPDFGLLSRTLPTTTCNTGLQCVQDSLTFTLVLTGGTTTVAAIDAADVILAFGSPNTPGPHAVVPEPGTLLLLSSGLVGLGVVWRTRT